MVVPEILLGQIPAQMLLGAVLIDTRHAALVGRQVYN